MLPGDFWLSEWSGSLNVMNNSEPGRGHAEAASGESQPFDSPRFWRWTALGLGLIAFGKGMHLPGPWPYTQAQLDYSAGFMRRGLFGAVLGRPLGLNVYTHFAVVSTVLLFFLFVVVGLLARKAVLVDRTPPGELVAVYASSYSVTYLAHLNGYMDIPLALLCVAPLFVRSTGWRLVAAMVCASLGMLMHEQFFFCFLPVLVVSVLLGAVEADTPGKRKLAWGGAVMLVMLGVGMTAFLARHGSISTAQVAQLSRTATLRADRPLSEDVFDVLPRTTQENFEIMKSVWIRPTFLPAQVESLLLFGPTAAVLSWATFLLLRKWAPRTYRWIYAAGLLVTLAPLSLNLMGWDKNRWNELLALNAFLFLLMACLMFGREPVQLPARLRRACLIVMLLNMATGGGLMGNLHIRPFPFLRSPDAITEHSGPW
jgi:hypothetical protein